LRVLLVEDNTGDVELVRMAVQRVAGHVNVDVARDGQVALERLRSANGTPLPDFVLLDLNLPRMNGFEVLEELKRDPELRSIPVVVLTSSDADRDIERAYRMQCAAYFTKPMAEMEPVIQRVFDFMGSVKLPSKSRLGSRPAPSVQTLMRRNGGGAQRDQLYRALFENCADPIVLTDLEGVVTVVNAATESTFGYVRDDLVGLSLQSLLAGDEPKGRLADVLDSARQGAGPQRIEFAVRHRDGRKLSISSSITPLLDALGRPSLLSWICRDITERTLADEKLQVAVELSPAAVIMVDSSGEIVLVNAETQRLFGYAREEMVGQSIELLVPERLRRPHTRMRAEFLRRPVARAMGMGRELFAVRKDGSEFPVEVGLNPVQTTEGRFVLGTVLDITERKQAEERFRLAVEAAPSAMVMIDELGEIILVNAETERLFRYGRDELIGKSVEMLVPRRLRGRHPAFRASFANAPSARAMGVGRDLFAMRKDGTEFPVEIGLNPIRTSSGLLVLAAIVDITERKRAEQALEARRRELERSNEELERFAYVASHDLQEPLRMVASYAQLLEREYGNVLDIKGRDYLKYSIEGAKRMQSLIRDLLAYSRVTTRGRSLALVDANVPLQRALDNLRFLIDEVGAEVRSEDLPSVYADETQLVELFQNLIGNAIKFRGDNSPAIAVSTQAEGDFQRFSVKDNGIGIEPAQAERIFDMFQRLHSRDAYPGTGIGLAICRRIVQRVGGRIWVESTGRGGCTFHFTLPREES
jgi:PAS domain S-box-containing protein